MVRSTMKSKAPLQTLKMHNSSSTNLEQFHSEDVWIMRQEKDTLSCLKAILYRVARHWFWLCTCTKVVKMFTLLVEAKDHGEVVSLSSSTTVVIHVEDGNNHLPTVIGQTVSESGLTSNLHPVVPHHELGVWTLTCVMSAAASATYGFLH